MNENPQYRNGGENPIVFLFHSFDKFFSFPSCVTFCLTTKSNQKSQEILILSALLAPKALSAAADPPRRCFITRFFKVDDPLQGFFLFLDVLEKKLHRSEIIETMGKGLNLTSYLHQSLCTAAHGKINN
jgi:hypothetical protein